MTSVTFMTLSSRYPFIHLGGEEKVWDKCFAQKHPVLRAGFEPGTFRSLDQHPTTKAALSNAGLHTFHAAFYWAKLTACLILNNEAILDRSRLTGTETSAIVTL
ncbi:hypothetical protein DPMN_072323 [Dreissena polymorpha]|uniref:Uncharacterized protein n=1 Tax=Dreissena polymorpha TaxID=45954 RepID=A0A9D3Z4C1_DREPO|nr:hypothetical protein DPMN_072323 [Dreissena polymorpha]